MSAPVVGVTSTLERAKSGVWDTQAVFLQAVYVDALVRAGGAVCVLPPQPALPDAVAAVLNGLDGLVVAGGADIDPAHYGEEPHSENDPPRPERDAWELALVEAAGTRALPFLGICRGAQVLNIVRGGTLLQHVPDIVGNKEHEGDGDRFGHVSVTTVPGTRIAALYPASGTVPVYHHQAIDRPGAGLVVSAHSEYGIVEAVEDPSAAFCLAVQWHPEVDSRPELFEALIAAATAYRAANRG